MAVPKPQRNAAGISCTNNECISVVTRQEPHENCWLLVVVLKRYSNRIGRDGTPQKTTRDCK